MLGNTLCCNDFYQGENTYEILNSVDTNTQLSPTTCKKIVGLIYPELIKE